jgi:TatD DNase family protein
MKLIDSHTHLTFEPLAGEIKTVLEHSKAVGISGWITVGTDTEHNKKVVSIINKYENLYGAVGIHPHYASKITETDIELVKELAKNQKIVAIGETGLDFHYDFSARDAQINLFKKLLQIAAECSLPIIIHSRDAFDETMEVIDKFSSKLAKVVFHCWGGTVEQTQIVLDKGFYISFTGVVTFKNAAQTRAAAKIVPLERMMLETDCPYMSPEPMRKQKINEPALMIYTAQKIAELKNMPLEKFARQATKTTENFFNLPAD